MRMTFIRAAAVAAVCLATAACGTTISQMKTEHLNSGFTRSSPKIQASYQIVNEAEIKEKRIKGYVTELYNNAVTYGDAYVASVKKLLDAHFQTNAPNAR